MLSPSIFLDFIINFSSFVRPYVLRSFLTIYPKCVFNTPFNSDHTLQKLIVKPNAALFKSFVLGS